MDAAKKRGRPAGSRTSGDTPAMRRARRYFELLGDGMKSMAAARAVAAEWQVSESTVFSDCARHGERLVRQLEDETRAIRTELGRMIEQAHPDVAVALALEFRSQPEGGAINHRDEWLVFLAEQYFTLQSKARLLI